MSSLTLLVPIGVLIGLIVRAAKKAPQEYVDLMVMLEDRHTSRIVDQIVRDQIDAAEAFDKGLTQGMETEYRLNFARVCTTFTDAMQSVAKALEVADTDEGDKESPNE